MNTRTRTLLVTLLAALLGLFASLGVAAPDVLTDLWNDDSPALPAPPVTPSVESHIDLLQGPAVERTHSDMRAERFEVEGEVKGDIPENLPLASPSQDGCTTKLVGNFSSRSGITPRMFVLHYTVSGNRTGFSDMDAIWSWFNNSRSQASSNYLIDFEGHCYLMVSEASKAWTQGAFNSSSISIEFIATGSESAATWKGAGLAGLKKAAKVVADSIRRWDIPFRFVNPDGCTVTAGITDHNRLECGNTHTDVEPNFPYAFFLDLVKSQLADCYRYEARDGGLIDASRRWRKGSGLADERLDAFLSGSANQDEMRRRLGRDDHDLRLVLRKVACR